jgi:hypothetical protein
MTRIADPRPGLNFTRLVRLMSDAIDRCALRLDGRTVLTEAATGAYIVTPILAAMAGATVYALAAPTDYATTDELRDLTTALADRAGVGDSIHLITAKEPSFLAEADIVTNTGQVRPVDAGMIALLKDSAVVPLMYESWEYRGADVDLNACRARDIPVAGTNEQHPAIDVFGFLGAMAVKQLHDAGVAVYRSRIALLCDNAFAPYITRGLQSAGAEVVGTDRLTKAALSPGFDAVVVAQRPGEDVALDAADAALLSEVAPGTIVVEYWGDTDRSTLVRLGVPVWPPHPAKSGHMAVLPSALGPEPIVRLQAGGLKVGEVLARGLSRASPQELAFIQLL